MKNQKRIAWIDTGKGFTIFCVVLYHAVNNGNVVFIDSRNNLAIYGLSLFIMPVFFALSGYLYTPHNIMMDIKKKFVSLLIPCFLFSAINILEYNIIPAKTNSHFSLSQIFLIPFIPSGAAWFIYTLFFVYLYMNLLHKYVKSTKIAVGIIIVLFGLALVLPFPPLIHNSIQGMLLWGGAFYIGYAYRSHEFLRAKRVFFLSIIILIISSIVIVLAGVIDANDFSLLDFIPKLFSIPVFFFLFRKIQKARINSYFEKYGQDSMVIYLIHYPLSGAARVLLMLFFPHMMTNFLIIFFTFTISWFGSIFAVYLVKRVKFVDIFFYPARYIRAIK